MVQKKAHVYSRRLEADLARNEMRNVSGARSLSPKAAGERRTQSDIVRNLKSKNRMLRQVSSCPPLVTCQMKCSDFLALGVQQQLVLLLIHVGILAVESHCC